MTDATAQDPKAGPTSVSDSPHPRLDAALRAAADGAMLRFSYGEVPVTATIRKNADSEAVYRIALRAVVGIVPCAADATGARKAFAMAIGDLPCTDSVSVGIDNHDVVFIEGIREVEAPISAGTILAAMVRLLVDLRPQFSAVGTLLPDLPAALPIASA